MSPKRRLAAPVAVAVSYLVGSIPVSGLVARVVRGVDLRQVGTGTVSGTGLYRVAGLGPLLVGGILDLLKGSIGVSIGGSDRKCLRIFTGSAAVVGHNWSIYLRGAGGRGLSPAMGALLVEAPEGFLVLLSGMAVGKSLDATSLGAFAADLALFPVLTRTRGRRGVMIAAALVTPMLLKRILGNRPPVEKDRWGVYLNRLLFDQDTPHWPHPIPHKGRQPT